MIQESSYWKDDLHKNIIFMRDKLEQRVWRQASFAALEKRIMLSCYIVRKLAEAGKITEELYQSPVTMKTYTNKGRVVDLLNSHRLEELYATQNPSTVTKPLSYIVNQIIHSFVFNYYFASENEIKGVLFNSDRSKSKELYAMDLLAFIRVLSPIANCYIGKSIMQRNENGEMVLVYSEEYH